MKKVLTFIFSLGFLLFTPIAFAAVIPTPTACPTAPANASPAPCYATSINIEQPTGKGIAADTPLGVVIGNIITIVLVLAALLVLIMIVWGGIEWIFSSGDKEKIGKARDRIIHALIGIAIIALAFLIARVISNLVNIDLFHLNIPTLGPPPS